jgi:hypothetical protein
MLRGIDPDADTDSDPDSHLRILTGWHIVRDLEPRLTESKAILYF